MRRFPFGLALYKKDRTVPRSLERGCALSPLLDQRDLLPDLARQVGTQILDVVDAIDDDVVIDRLGEQSGDLAGDRQHLRAIVEIAREIGGIGDALWRLRCRLEVADSVAGSLVSWCMSMTWISERRPCSWRKLLALDAFLGADQRQKAKHGEDDGVDRSLDALHRLHGIVGARNPVERQDRADEQEHSTPAMKAATMGPRSHQIGASKSFAALARSRDSDTSSAATPRSPALGKRSANRPSSLSAVSMISFGSSVR